MKLTSTRMIRLLNWFRELSTVAELYLRVSGKCMVPALLPGKQVRVSRQRLYLPGDVLAVMMPSGQLRVHRLVGYRWHRGGLAVITAPDNQRGFDSPVWLNFVLGRVVQRDREIRFVVSPKTRLRAVARYFRYIAEHLTRWLGF